MTPADQHALREALARAEAERDEAVQLAYDLKYAAAGGEDVPGSANTVRVEDVARWRDDAWQRTDALDRAVAQAEARALAAEVENTRLKETVEAAKPKIWVVTNNERGAERRYRMWSGRAWVWTADPAQAAQFARKTDANQILPDGSPFDYADRVATLDAARSVLATIPPKENP